MTDGKYSKGRDERGRFTKGNPGGPGGSRPRAYTLRRAAEAAINTEHVEAMVRKATRLALEGNLSAMRLVLDRVCGKPVEAQPEPEALPLKLPDLRRAADCNQALGRILDGIVAGTVDREAARLLIDAVDARRRAIEAEDLEARIVALENGRAQ